VPSAPSLYRTFVCAFTSYIVLSTEKTKMCTVFDLRFSILTFSLVKVMLMCNRKLPSKQYYILKCITFLCCVMTLFIIIRVIKQIMFNHVLTLQRCAIDKKKIILLSLYSVTLVRLSNKF